MKLTANKELADWLDQFVKANNLAECAELRLVSDINYPGFGSIYSLADYDLDADKYRVIAITYPYDCYACPLFISTPMLKEKCRFKNPKTNRDIINMFTNMIAI